MRSYLDCCVFGAAFLAAAVADVVALLGADPFPVFSVTKYPTPPLETLPAFAILGIVAGLVGVAFNRGVVASLNFYGRGVPGGIFAPLLVLGALIGLAVGKVAIMAVPTANVGPAVFAVVGMAEYFTAIVRAPLPLTSVILLLEMTGNYEQMLPLLISCFFAYTVAALLKDLPIYEVLLERDVLSGREPTDLTQPVVMDFTIQEGAPIEGQCTTLLQHLRDSICTIVGFFNKSNR